MSEKIRLTYVSKMIIIPAMILLAAVIFGSINAGCISDVESKNLSAYLAGFFEQIPKSDKTLLFSSLKKNFTVWFLFSISGAVLPAFLVNVATLLERGFVIGYTSASFCRIYGIKGVLACLSLLPEMVIFVPILVVFSSISLKMSFLSHENKKVFLRKYLFFVFFFLSVFCVVSVFQTFATTIFMSWASKAL